MSADERFKFMATANRVTVGFIEQVVDKPKKQLKRSYIARVRGIPVCDNNGQWKFDTPEEALEFGRSVLMEWKKDFTASPSAS